MTDHSERGAGAGRRRLSVFHPRDLWDRLFEVGIVVKGLDGVLELVGGLALLFLSPDQLRGLVLVWTREELSEDPRDYVATHLLHSAGALTGDAVLFGAVYLLVHGLVKVVLVAALLLNRLWAYPAMIAVLLGFIGYQLYRISLHPTPGLIGLTLFDAAVVALTWLEYRRQRSPSGASDLAGPGPADSDRRARDAARAHRK